MTRIRAVIFDLDNCLAAAFEAIRMANHGRLSRQQLDEAFADCWRHALDRVAEKHRFSEEMYRAGFDAFRRIEVKRPLRGYGDLDVQESKIEALGVRGLFDEIHVHAIDEAGSPGKKDIFREILSRRGWRPEEVLVVGDNAESEIAAGNELGMATVQTLRPGVPHAPSARRHTKSLAELLSYA